MLKDTKNLQAGDLITHLDGHKLGKPVKVARFVEVTPDGTVEVDVEQPDWSSRARGGSRSPRPTGPSRR
jgi:hypothetical protein